MWKKIGIAVVVLVVLCCGGLFLFPTTWHVEKSVVIAAPPAEIHAIVDRPRTWLAMVERFARKQENGASARFQYTFGGPESGKGTWWISEADMNGQHSKVRIEYTASDPESGVEYEGMIESETVNSHGSVRYAPVEGGTKVTWTDTGDLPRGLGVGAKLLETGLGPFFQGTLEELKAAVEAHEAIPDVE